MAPTLDTVLITLAAFHLAAFGGLILAARFSTRLVDDAGRPIDRREPEPRPGDVPDPAVYRRARPRRPSPRFLL